MISKKWYELGCIILLAVITTLLFWDGSLDIAIEHLFYNPEDPENPWPLGDFWLWRLFYDAAFPSVIATAVIALALFLSSFLVRSKTQFRFRALYVISVILLGPVVMVNLVLKDHWGRPRPKEIVEFNGQYDYQPPAVISETGGKSFVCGHCSSGYMFFALYFILQKMRNIALLCTILYSLLMGFVRMSAGGHFISDVLWSGYVVFGVCWFLYYFVFREFAPRQGRQARQM